MKLPTQHGLPILTFGLLLTASTALAQSVHFNQVDGNRDGLLSGPELVEALGSEDLSESLILNLDQNEDGQLSRSEVRAAADRDDEEEEEEGDEDEGEDDSEDEGDESEDDEGDGEDDGDGNHGHGNDEDGFDDDNPGRGHGNDGKRGGGRGGDNPGRGHGKND